MRRTFGSVRTRLTIFYAAALACGVLVFSVAVYLLVGASLSREMDQRLNQDLAAVGGAARLELDDIAEFEQQGTVSLFQVDQDSRVIAASRGWRRVGLGAALGRASVPAPLQWRASNGRTYHLRARYQKAPQGMLRIAVARDGDLMRYTLRSLAVTMLLGLACALALAVGGGYVLAGRVLSPITAMASKAQSITADHLGERLPVGNPHDELGRLAAAFNSTLARLQDAFDRLRRFTSDASHELRTPLTAIRSVGEVALRGQDDANAYRDAIGSMLEEAERLARRVDSLLMLTRVDSGAVALAQEETDLAKMAHEAADYLRVLAEEKDLTLSVESPGPVLATVDRALLRQALVNLLDNAVRNTPAGGRITVSVSQRSSGGLAIEVTDTGPGIPAQHRDRVFDRFYRVEEARSREHGGAGLGLAIALWAVRANGGAIELETEEGKGSTFRIVLPSAKGGGAADH